MYNQRPRFLAFVAITGLALSPLGAGHADAQQVGTAAAVNPAAQARGPGGSRTIIIGQSIAHRERVQTTSAGSVQLLFLDKTSMTVGPNSDLAIDEYVYDPSSNTGKLAATLTKGVMRFVGGQISHAGNAQITTPNAVVGIRGGVGIIGTQQVFVGYGEGQVTSGASSVALSAGEYTQTPGGGVPPTNPGPPPSGFLQSVLATLQSQPGQGGGARATAAQVNQARRVATGSSTGNIATNLQDATNRALNVQPPPWINQTIQIANQGRLETFDPQTGALNDFNGVVQATANPSQSSQSPNTLFGYTGGLIRSIGQNGLLGGSFAAFGSTSLQSDPSGRSQANFTIASATRQSQNALQFGSIQFGSVDPGLPSGQVTISQLDQLIGTADALLPAVDANGTPLSTVNAEQLTQHQGLFVEIKPGSQLSNALARQVGTTFCQCDYTRWGLWDSEFSRPGPNNSTINEQAKMFWVAGRLPNAGEVPSSGTATYTGHAIANIRNGSQTYIAAGAFQNVVNFGTRSGNVSVTGLDSTNYAGRMFMGSSDPRFFGASLTGVNNQSRNMVMSGSFFAGTTSPVGEMGGALQLGGPSYVGAGIFAGRMR